MSSDFTIAFICHGDFDLYSRTIKQNIDALCSGTSVTYDLVLIIDGAENLNVEPAMMFAKSCGINEVRLRYRHSNCTTGDPSNNGHFHLISDKTRFLISFEEDVVLFKLDQDFDVLSEIKEKFEKHKDLTIATRIDDYDCWAWKLEQIGENFSSDVASVNRVSSHFLIYDTLRLREYIDHNNFSYNIFWDKENSWYNYEDFLSYTLAKPNGPGIGFFTSFPIKVFHCDKKINEGSPYYTKDSSKKINIFESKRKAYLKE